MIFPVPLWCAIRCCVCICSSQMSYCSSAISYSTQSRHSVVCRLKYIASLSLCTITGNSAVHVRHASCQYSSSPKLRAPPTFDPRYA